MVLGGGVEKASLKRAEDAEREDDITEETLLLLGILFYFYHNKLKIQ